jgi:hypothetical protein
LITPDEIVNVDMINRSALLHACNSLQASVWIGTTQDLPHAGEQRCIRHEDHKLAEEEYEPWRACMKSWTTPTTVKG